MRHWNEHVEETEVWSDKQIVFFQLNNTHLKKIHRGGVV